MKKVLVTGGCGYIGSHTIIDLLDNGFEVVSVDNLINADLKPLDGIKEITGVSVKNYVTDLCDLEKTRQIFLENEDIVGIIHFAALKSVGESVFNPLQYFKNNLDSLLNILSCAKEFNINNIIFSSSCSVYGNAKDLPVTEDTQFETAESPYARTKQIGEYIPVITEAAIGRRDALTVFGDDYDTRDGSCIRDYIHVMDLANAHTKSLEYLLAQKNTSNCEVFNLGIGDGVTVLEAINAFEKVSGQKLNYNIGPRREGDVVAIYANNNKAAQKLTWNATRNIDDIMKTAWEWEQKRSAKMTTS